MDALSSVVPGVKTAGAVTVQALDSLPLPILVVLFLACLATLNWPTTSTPLLPFTSSCLPTSTPSPSQTSFVFLDPRAEKGAAVQSPRAYVATTTTANGVCASPPRMAGRRGSRGLYREYRSLLPVLEEKAESEC
ncbi:hypothetical protein Q5752_006700 [Cryptotrichosporon argae]